MSIVAARTRSCTTLAQRTKLYKKVISRMYGQPICSPLQSCLAIKYHLTAHLSIILWLATSRSILRFDLHSMGGALSMKVNFPSARNVKINQSRMRRKFLLIAQFNKTSYNRSRCSFRSDFVHKGSHGDVPLR